jgi:16S rRNA processing protein RimM
MKRPPGGIPDEFFAVGKVLSAHGIHGDVVVQVWTDQPHRFEVGRKLRCLENGGATLTVQKVRKSPRGLIVRFQGLNTRTDAEQLTGAILAISAAQRGDPEEDACYVSDLIGCRVTTETGRELGAVVDVISQPHHDLYSVQGPYGQILIPAVRQFIKEIDTQHHRLIVKHLEAFWDGKID